MATLQYSPKHEQIVLGTCLKYENVLHKLIKSKSLHFSVEAHRIIWAGLQTIAERKIKYTPGTLETILPSGGEGWNGRGYLQKLESMAQRENLKFHLERMEWDIARVDLFSDDLAQLTNIIKDPTESATRAKQLTDKISKRLASLREDDPIEAPESLIAKAQASVRARRIAGPNFRTSGYVTLDRNLDEGFADRRLSVISATPSSGKTSFMLNLARRQAMEHGIKVGIMAWEGGRQAAIDSMCASALGIPLNKFTKYAKNITDEEQENIDDFIANILGHDKILFMKPPPNKIMAGAPWDVTRRVLDWVEEQLDRWGRDVIYWDLFLKKLPAATPEQVTQALNRVQDMIDEDGGPINSHMCLLHQINLKTVEGREDKRPTRSDLKGSGAWVEAPDLVWTLHRPAVHEPGLEDNIIEITCWKQRKGRWPWRVNAEWEGPYVRVGEGKNSHMRKPRVAKPRGGKYKGKV